MYREEIGSEIAGVGVTALRYGIAEHVARRVESEEDITLGMATLVAADVLDGIVLRHLDLDTPVRRLADGVLDYLSIARVGGSIASKYPETRPYFGILAARTVLVGGLNAVHQYKTDEVTKSSKRHRLTTLSVAGFALAAVEGSSRATKIAGSLMAGIAVANLPSYFRGLGVKHPSGFRQA